MIKKAVIPVAGRGTRMMPATRVVPKELLPVFDRPAIEWVVEEALASGIEEIIFVTRPEKQSIIDHFVQDPKASKIKPSQIRTIVQEQPLGLGHAILTAQPLVGSQPFAVMLPDEVFQGPEPCLKQLIKRTGKDVLPSGHLPGGHLPRHHLMVRNVDQQHAHRYGIVAPAPGAMQSSTPNAPFPVASLVEKPPLGSEPSLLAVVGRYVLQPSIFTHLARVAPQEGSEIQLTDAITDSLTLGVGVEAVKLVGDCYDCGSRQGWLAAQIAFAYRSSEKAILESPQLRRTVQNCVTLQGSNRLRSFNAA